MDVDANCPQTGWFSNAVALLKKVSAEIAKTLTADKATAAVVVDGVSYGHPAGLAKSFELMQESLKRECGGNANVMAESSGMLIASADESWVEDEAVYEIESGKKYSLE